MKQHKLNLKKELLIIEFPEGARDLKVFHDIVRPYISYFVKSDTARLYLEEDAELIGKLTDITEDQFKEWVKDKDSLGYWDYYTGFAPVDTAKESLFSKMESEGILFKNPFKKPADDDFSFYTDKNISVQEEWQESQSKVWDINRTYLFLIIN